LVPLLGSLVTEPAAMTLAAHHAARQLCYGAGAVHPPAATPSLGVLFVNVSIGGTLTPVCCAAGPDGGCHTWQLGQLAFVLTHPRLAGRRGGAGQCTTAWSPGCSETRVARPAAPAAPPATVAVPAARGGWCTCCSWRAWWRLPTTPAAFLGLLLFSIGFAHRLPKPSGPAPDRCAKALLVAFFLAGLVVLGGRQQWWLEPLLRGMEAIDRVLRGHRVDGDHRQRRTDLPGLAGQGPERRVRASAAWPGPVTGGGLTVIANAPNPAGFAILKGSFEDEAIHPGAC